jgi:hypothetical protein
MVIKLWCFSRFLAALLQYLETVELSEYTVLGQNVNYY